MDTFNTLRVITHVLIQCGSSVIARFLHNGQAFKEVGQ